MAVRVVRLGSGRLENEGTRIGTVRRPPRGVPYCEDESHCHRSVLKTLLADSDAELA